MKKCYTLTIKTLSPVHIASGNTINKLEYVYSKESKTVYIMDMIKLSDFLMKRKLMDVFIDRVQSGDKLFSLSSFFSDKVISESEYKQYSAYSYKNDNISVTPNQMEISGFVKDAYGCPYIPGSSIKGALRTAIAYEQIMDKNEDFSDFSARVASDIKSNKSINEYERELNEKVFHTLKRKTKFNSNTNKNEPVTKDILNDCMSGLLISDSKPILPENLVLCQKTDLQIDGVTHSINILRECIKPGTDIVFDIIIDTDLCPFSIEKIMGSLRRFYEDYDYVFRSIFIKEANGKVYEPQKEKTSEYIYLGGGVGFPTKTVIFSLYKDEVKAAELVSLLLEKNFRSANHIGFTRKEKISPKVLKCTMYQNKLHEMGLCEIHFKEKK